MTDDPGGRSHPEPRWNVDEGGDERRAQARHHEDGAGRAGGAEAALEPLLAAVAHALRRPPALDPALDDRVMAAVRATPIAAAGPAAGPAPAEAGEGRASPLARGWRWLRRPRTLRVSPLGGGLVGLAGLAAAAALTLMVSGGGEAPADGRLAAGDPAAATAAATAAPAAPDTVQVVQFVLVAPDARTVALVGDFND